MIDEQVKAGVRLRRVDDHMETPFEMTSHRLRSLQVSIQTGDRLIFEALAEQTATALGRCADMLGALERAIGPHREA